MVRACFTIPPTLPFIDLGKMYVLVPTKIFGKAQPSQKKKGMTKPGFITLESKRKRIRIT